MVIQSNLIREDFKKFLCNLNKINYLKSKKCIGLEEIDLADGKFISYITPSGHDYSG